MKIRILATAILWMAGTVASFAQDSGSTDVNIPDPADETLVQGNGTKPGQNSTGAHVNTFTGDVWATVTDFNYRRIGFPLKFERCFHNGITSPFGEMGQDWMSNYDICLFVPMSGGGDHATLTLPHQSWRFSTTDGGNTFSQPPGCFYQLQTANTSSVFTNPPSNYSSTTYVLTDKFGMVYKFNVLNGGEQNLARLVEMDDLDGNKLTLTYQSFSYFLETINFGSPSCYYVCTDYQGNQNISGYSIGGESCTQVCAASITYGLNSYRLQTVSENNWNNSSINCSYYDNPQGPVTIFGDPVETIQITTNFFGNRLKQVTNSAGDTITFDSGVQPGPITQVTRAPLAINASYQYYSYPATVSSVPTTITTLKQIIDPLAPPGYRNLTYVSENNPSTGINNPVRQIVNNMGQVMFTYDYSTDSSGNKVASTNGPNGLIEADVYDSTSRIIQKRFQVDGHPYNEIYTWNINNLMTNKVDGNGHAVTMNYDSLGNMIYRQDAEGYQEYYTYNGISRLTNSTDKNQVSRSYTYDGHGNLTSKIEPGQTTTYSYYSTGLLNTVTDANIHTTTYNYDANGNVSSIQEPLVTGQSRSAITSFIYDNGNTSNGQGRGFLTSKTDPLNAATTFIYSNINPFLLQSVNYADMTSINYAYNSNMAITQVTDKNGNITNTYMDSEDRPVSTVQAAGTTVARSTVFQLDPIGNQLSITDGKGQTTRFIVNEQNLVRSSTDSLGVGATNSYDGALNLISSRDTRGITKTMSYYPNNRLKTATFSDGTPGLSYTYDGNGNRTGMTDAVGLKNYTYDNLNRLTSLSDSARNFTINYTYDPVGNRLSMRNNKINGITYYGYYENNLMKAVTDVDGMAMSYVYDLMKNPVTVFYPNGASVTYSYVTANHRLQSLQNLNSSNEIISSFSYVYDNVGNINSVTDLTGTTSYGYDNLYQLTNATYPGPLSVIGYGYDGAGNRISITQNNSPKSYTYNSGNEMTNASNLGETYYYDGAGSVTQRSSGSGTTNYTWNALNQLIKVNMPSGSVTFVYDGDGHRAQKMTNKGTTNYFYDSKAVVVETDGSGDVLKSYNPQISVKDSQGNKLFYLHNGHGDVVGLMDTKQGLVQNYIYDVFGAALGNQKDLNNYRYVGLGDVYSDDDIGLQYMWHRWYEPRFGRFISRDPTGFKGGLNFYEYCLNNPATGIDPKGLDSDSDRMHDDEGAFFIALMAALKEPSPISITIATGAGVYLVIGSAGNSERDSYAPFMTQFYLAYLHVYPNALYPSYKDDGSGNLDYSQGFFQFNSDGSVTADYQGSIITFSDYESFCAARDAAGGAQARAIYDEECQAQAEGEYINWGGGGGSRSSGGGPPAYTGPPMPSS